MATIRILMIALSIAVLWFGMLSGPAAAQTDQEIFTDQLAMPEGIAIDSTGRIVVHSNGTATTILTLFSPLGIPSDPVPLGAGPIDSLRFLGSRLDTDRVTDRLYLLSRNGDILIVDPITLQEVTRYDLRDIPIITTNVFDLNRGVRVDFILSPQTLYGDIAIYHSPTALSIPPGSSTPLQTPSEQLEFFLTGFSDTIPFVLRLQVDPASDTITSTQVVLISTVPFPDTLNTPRGIAVNSQGTVFTSLPIATATSADCPDAIVNFTHEFPSPETTRPQVIDNSEGIPSWGMSVDQADNVYAVTGGAGNTACREAGAGSLIFIRTSPETPTIPEASPVSIRRITAFLPTTSARPEDVVFSPLMGRQVYLTISNFNTVLRLPAIPLPTP